VDGVSLVPLLRGGASLGREAIYWHYPHYHPGGATPYSAIRQGDHKLIEFFEDSHVELYDLRQDIGESTDLAATQPELAQRLRERLAAWRIAVGAQLPTPNPDYDPAREQGGPARRSRPDLPSKDFAILRGAEASAVADGWLLSAKDEGTALTKLAQPITGRAVFEVEVQTQLRREDGWQNAFLAFAGSTRDEDLIVAGVYLGGLRLAAWQGLSTAKQGEIVVPATFDRQQRLTIQVVINMPGHKLSLQVAGKTLTRDLPKDLDAIRFVGYHLMQTKTQFSSLHVRTE